MVLIDLQSKSLIQIPTGVVITDARLESIPDNMFSAVGLGETGSRFRLQKDTAHKSVIQDSDNIRRPVPSCDLETNIRIYRRLTIIFNKSALDPHPQDTPSFEINEDYLQQFELVDSTEKTKELQPGARIYSCALVVRIVYVQDTSTKPPTIITRLIEDVVNTDISAADIKFHP